MANSLTKIKTNAIDDDAVTLAKQAAGTDGQIITYDASGNPTAVGPGTDGQVLTSTGAGSPPAFETPAAGVGGATGVDFNDSVKARFGTGNDLRIDHNGTRSKIENLTGDLKLSSDSIKLTNYDDDETYLKCLNDGAVTLYHDDTVRFETTSGGTKTTGKSEIDGDVQWNGSDDSWGAYWDKSANSVSFKDDKKILLGTGNDLEIYHDASHSWIKNTTGNLVINTGTGTFKVWSDGNEEMIDAAAGGAVKLYYDNVNCLQTGANTVQVNNRLQIHADAPNTGHGLSIGQWDGSNHRLEGDANRPLFITSYNSGGVKLGVSGANEVTVTADGLTFNGDTAAANALDDYEEGDWNPVLYGTSSAGTTTYTTRSGSYTKIGNLVTVNIYLNWSNQTGSGDMAISSMPFTRKAGTNYETVGTVVFSNWDYNSGEQTVGYMGDGTVLYFRQTYDNEAWQGVQHDSSGELMASVTYRTT